MGWVGFKGGDTFWESEGMPLMAMLSQESQSQPPPTKSQPSAGEPKTWPYKDVEDRCCNLEIKETLTGALKLAEGMFSMPRVDITSPYSGGFY